MCTRIYVFVRVCVFARLSLGVDSGDFGSGCS